MTVVISQQQAGKEGGDSIRLVKRCTKPDRKEFQKIAMATAIVFAIMGFIGFFVKLIHIPINDSFVTLTVGDPNPLPRLAKDITGHNKGKQLFADLEVDVLPFATTRIPRCRADINPDHKDVIPHQGKNQHNYEQNYSISELECLAINESIEYFRVYLLGRHFTIYSDHQALVYLKNIKNPSAQGYDKHRRDPGKRPKIHVTYKNGSRPVDNFIEELPGEAIKRLLESCRTSGDHIYEGHSTDQDEPSYCLPGFGGGPGVVNPTPPIEQFFAQRGFWERGDELQYASLEHPTHALLDSGPEIWLANPSFEYSHSGDIY
ncbi:SEC61G [Cordylochernes scorpioides]|uniref:SEC61G n=1 Tax=Cordylochernes scorpioides TaxID=51811 RepID=A0ABY6KFI2_9ARAC|nr:SEC61G [Cordylochernes scorpioides]